jgi:hypothetical protein
MEIDIERNIKKYLENINHTERYASFDYCFNYFQSFRERNCISGISDPENTQESCLQLGFYLASWGMMRGSTVLIRKSAKYLQPLIELIASLDGKIWTIDANDYSEENILKLLECREEIKKALQEHCLPSDSAPTDVLVTKIMLGVFGNVPAFDTFFCKGFGIRTLDIRSLQTIGEFYNHHKEEIEQHQQRTHTLDFMTEQPTHRLYTRAKIIDMIGFIEGIRKNRRTKH